MPLYDVTKLSNLLVAVWFRSHGLKWHLLKIEKPSMGNEAVIYFKAPCGHEEVKSYALVTRGKPNPTLHGVCKRCLETYNNL